MPLDAQLIGVYFQQQENFVDAMLLFKEWRQGV
jgi:hypothetical protein